MKERANNSKSFDDESLSASSSSSSSSSSGDEDHQRSEARDEVKEVRKLAHKETQNVLVWKLMVFVMLVGTSAMVCAGTYIFLKKSEDDDYSDSVSIDDLARYTGALKLDTLTAPPSSSTPSSTTSLRTLSRMPRTFTSKVFSWPRVVYRRRLQPSPSNRIPPFRSSQSQCLRCMENQHVFNPVLRR
jgi:hypothetical protein